MMLVCVVGLGQIGLPVAQYAHVKGQEVWGYDINPKIIQETRKEDFKTTDIWEEIPPADVYIICVTTSYADEGPDLSPVFNVCTSISEKAKKETLVSIESTIIPGTSKKIYNTIFNKKIKLVHAPHRYWADEPEKHGVNQLRVIGGINSESLTAALEFYQGSLGIPMHKVSSIEAAEMCKITENSHRFLQIAFAEELRMMCSKLDIDFEELRNACNTKWNVDIPEARGGIGRHCLPKDIRYVTTLVASDILQSAMNVDKKYREWLNQQK